MESVVELEICHPAPTMCGDNGHFHVTDGDRVWKFIVTEEALMSTATPPEASRTRLIKFIGQYRNLAQEAIARKDVQDGTAWIFERDILERQGLDATRYRPTVSTMSATV